MERMNVREFRAGFSTLTEPVEVLKGTQTIGFFFPGDKDPRMGVPTPRFQPDPGAQERFNTRPFTPVPKGKAK